MSFQLGRPSTLVALALGAALGLAAAAFIFESNFLEVALEAGLLVEVVLVGEPDAADMDDNNVESTVQSERTYIRTQTLLISGCADFYSLLIAYHNTSTRLDT